MTLPLRDAWLLAAGTLTAVRVPPPSRVDRSVAGLAMVLAPLAVLLVFVLWLVLVAATQQRRGEVAVARLRGRGPARPARWHRRRHGSAP